MCPDNSNFHFFLFLYIYILSVMIFHLLLMSTLSDTQGRLARLEMRYELPIP